MLSKYLSNPDYNFDKVNRASVACGPLVKWAIAQVRRRVFFFTFHLKNKLLGDTLKSAKRGHLQPTGKYRLATITIRTFKDPKVRLFTSLKILVWGSLNI